MKKLILIGTAIFLVTFLAFPSYKEGSTSSCKDDVLFSGNCAPKSDYTPFGGIRYITAGLSTGFVSDPYRTPKDAFIINNTDSEFNYEFFEPTSALLYSALITFIVLAGIVGVRRIKAVLK